MFINTGKRLDGYFINTQSLQDLKTVNVDIDLCPHDTFFLFLKGESNEKWREDFCEAVAAVGVSS